MKRIILLLLVLVMAFSVVACSDEEASVTEDIDNITDAQEDCTEQTILELINYNIDCYYMFYVSPVDTVGEADKDGYYKAVDNFFESYNDLKEFLAKTYTSEKCDELLAYPSEDKPLYKNVDGEIYVNPDVITPVDYTIAWDDVITVEFTEKTKQKCSFDLVTYDFDGNKYYTNGSVVHQDKAWVLSDMIY